MSLPGVPDLSRERTLFNRSALVSTNALWKLGRGEFKTQVDYSFNRVTAEVANVITYFLNVSDGLGGHDGLGGRGGCDGCDGLGGRDMSRPYTDG